MHLVPFHFASMSGMAVCPSNFDENHVLQSCGPPVRNVPVRLVLFACTSIIVTALDCGYCSGSLIEETSNIPPDSTTE